MYSVVYIVNYLDAFLQSLQHVALAMNRLFGGLLRGLIDRYLFHDSNYCNGELQQ